MEGILKAICISEKKGTAKYPIPEVNLIEDFGLEKDAHAGHWHRQVSLLNYETREEFKKLGSDVVDGAFGENLLVSNIDFPTLPIGSQIQIGDTLLELTQRGKSCHSHCAIYHQVGKCIMPTNGVFAKVLKGGKIKVGDKVKVIEVKPTKKRVAVLTLSDKGSKGLREDLSGPYIKEYMEQHGYLVTSLDILPDDKKQIEQMLIDLADRRDNDLILTTGGTGLSPRDVTPEATLKVATRLVPGMSEAIRYESMKYTNKAMLSRAVSVIRHQTLIINLPGSVKAVRESLDIIIDPLKHGLDVLKGEIQDCGEH
mgnify:CR=1 FL=1